MRGGGRAREVGSEEEAGKRLARQRHCERKVEKSAKKD